MARSARRIGSGLAVPLPQGWERVAAADVCSKITKGTTPPSAEVSDDGEIPFIRVNNLTTGGARSLAGQIIFVSRHAHTGFLSRSIAFPGDVLMNIVGPPLGKLTNLDDTFQEYNLNQAVLIYRTVGERLKNEFLYYYLSSDGAQQWLDNRAKQTSGQKNLTIELCKQLPIPLPPLFEQAKVVEVLSTWDRAIETAERLLNNSERQTQAIVQQLISSGAHRRNWETRRLDEVSTRVLRKNDGEVHEILTISASEGFLRQEDKYSRYMAGKSVENYILLERGEFAYNKGNSKTYKSGCVFPLETHDVALVPHVYVCFRLASDLNRHFYKHLFASDYLAPQLGRLVNTGVRNNGLLNITPSDFLATTIPVPPRAEQDAMAKIIDTASLLAAEQRRNLMLLKQEKRALIQQLFAGKRRVKLDQVGAKAVNA